MISLAYFALLAWPVVALVLFLMMPAGRATIWSLLGGYLLLPIFVGFDLPGLPMLDKSSIPNLAALIFAPLLAKGGEFRWPRSRFINMLMAAHILSGFATAVTNPDPVVIGASFLPGIGWGEALQTAANRGLEIIPFLLGAALLGHEKGHRQILMAFTVAGIAYSIPILAEIRLSPFLQARIYGVDFTEWFVQQFRDGGFRAMVFLGHGLLVSAFIAMALIASIGLARLRVRIMEFPVWLATIFLAGVLVVNKSVGATVLGLAMGGLLIVMPSKRFVTLAMVIATMIVTYPAVRGAGLLPYNSLLSVVDDFSPDRAQSLQFRLDNEEILLNRAEQRPLFGWGSYGRNRVIVVTDYGQTRDISVTDGTWIITLGIYGWIGYITCFGLLTYPIWRAYRMRNQVLPVATVTLVAMLLLNLIDVIPNSSLRPITWLAAGALASLSLARKRVPVESANMPSAGRSRLVTAR